MKILSCFGRCVLSHDMESKKTLKTKSWLNGLTDPFGVMPSASVPSAKMMLEDHSKHRLLKYQLAEGSKMC